MHRIAVLQGHRIIAGSCHSAKQPCALTLIGLGLLDVRYFDRFRRSLGECPDELSIDREGSSRPVEAVSRLITWPSRVPQWTSPSLSQPSGSTTKWKVL